MQILFLEMCGIVFLPIKLIKELHNYLKGNSEITQHYVMELFHFTIFFIFTSTQAGKLLYFAETGGIFLLNFHINGIATDNSESNQEVLSANPATFKAQSFDWCVG